MPSILASLACLISTLFSFSFSLSSILVVIFLLSAPLVAPSCKFQICSLVLYLRIVCLAQSKISKISTHMDHLRSLCKFS